MEMQNTPRWVSARNRLPAVGYVIVKTSINAPMTDAFRADFRESDARHWRKVGFVWLEEVPVKKAEAELSMLLARFASLFVEDTVPMNSLVAMGRIFILCIRQKNLGARMFKNIFL